ncbi:MAG: adenylyl-sulfate kinase [Deltaproteobacteria bacterium]|nr:adenylyl-sulfate kinase [Deltaproteobacteria bacterium]
MKPGTLIWITGFAGAGKSTLAKELKSKLNQQKHQLVLLDGDDFRDLMGNDLGYSDEDRLQNAERIARFCSYLTSQGLAVICATMSLYSKIHDFNRKHNPHYLEVLLKCEDSELCRRDQKGLYSQKDQHPVVGKNQSYQLPQNPDLVLQNDQESDISNNVLKIINLLNA